LSSHVVEGEKKRKKNAKETAKKSVLSHLFQSPPPPPRLRKGLAFLCTLERKEAKARKFKLAADSSSRRLVVCGCGLVGVGWFRGFKKKRKRERKRSDSLA
jgi:hypothetical protein